MNFQKKYNLWSSSSAMMGAIETVKGQKIHRYNPAAD
jgi:hypothetical protein